MSTNKKKRTHFSRSLFSGKIFFCQLLSAKIPRRAEKDAVKGKYPAH